VGQARREIFLQTGLDRANQLDPVQQIALLHQSAQVPGLRAALPWGRFAATNYLNGYSSKLNFKKATGI
jgi:hypothetical protein